jgi:ArsR family transcriptional regulator
MTEVFKVLGDENRLRILNILSNAELCVCELEVILELSQSNVSRHLSKLKSVKLISSSKDAQWIHYKLNEDLAEEYNLLIQFIKEGFQREEIFKKDLCRVKKYFENNLSCKIITEDKEFVLNKIK